MAKLTVLKQEVVDNMLTIVRKEMKNQGNSNYERRIFLMVERSLAGRETAWAESMLRNFIGRFDLANMLIWVNQDILKSSLNINDPESFWTEKK